MSNSITPPLSKKSADRQAYPGKPRISSKGKRLLALLLDFILALLLVNTMEQFFRTEYWDLAVQTRRFEQLSLFYGSIAGLMLIRDLAGNSPGRIMLGMTLRRLARFDEVPDLWTRLRRNLMLLLLPIEGISLLIDPYANRLSDRWLGTVVLDHPKPLRVSMRLLFGNLIFFGFFTAAILLQKSALKQTAAHQAAEKAIRNHPELTLLLSRFPGLEETEMSLDLRDSSTPSMMRTVVGKGKQRTRVQVFLQQKADARSWQVSEIRLEPVQEE